MNQNIILIFKNNVGTYYLKPVTDPLNTAIPASGCVGYYYSSLLLSVIAISLFYRK